MRWSSKSSPHLNFSPHSSQSVTSEGGGEGGGGAGEGEEDPSRLRVEKEGISILPRDMTRCLPEVGDGEMR